MHGKIEINVLYLPYIILTSVYAHNIWPIEECKDFDYNI